MPIDRQPPLVIWCLSDGKPGHEKQTRGLANALMRLMPAEIYAIPVHSRRRGWLQWLTARFPPGDTLPDPDLILAAGHATHTALMAARRARGGKAIVLMKPSLPLGLFDLCLIPEHDRPPLRANVITTRGALNSLTPGERHDPDRGLILVGGPSPHFVWDSRAIVAQITSLARGLPRVRWTLTTSRRTPADFIPMLPTGVMACIPAEDSVPGWLEQQLVQVGQAWVTPDSVSMLYEALTAGCRVGVFHLPSQPNSRVAAALADRIHEGAVMTLPIADGDAPMSSAGHFDEAGRCAALIMDRWWR